MTEINMHVRQWLFELGKVVGGLAREDIQDYLAGLSGNMEDIEKFRLQINDFLRITVYRPEE